MKLFKKVLLNLFKILLALAISVATILTDIFLKIECLLIEWNSKLYPKHSVKKEDYLNQLREEYKKENSRKIVSVD
jgi:hypothetical protein